MHFPTTQKNGRIQVQETDDEIVFTWQVANTVLEWRKAIAFHVFWLVITWPFGQFFFIRSMVDASQTTAAIDEFRTWFRLLGWVGWTIGGVFAGLWLVAIARSSPTSKLILTRDTIQYKEGTSWHSKTDPTQLLTKVDRFSGTIRDVRNLQVRSVGDRLRLSIDLKADRVEIGKSLDDIEKRQLHRILEQWIDSTISSRDRPVDRYNQHNTKLRFRRFPGGVDIIWKNPDSPIYLRVLDAIFLLLWLGGWAMGEVSILYMLWQLLSWTIGFNVLRWLGAIVAFSFLIFFLSVWTLGGLSAMLSLLIAVLGVGDSKLKLDRDILSYQYSNIETCKRKRVGSPNSNRDPARHTDNFYLDVWREIQLDWKILSGQNNLTIDKNQIRTIALNWFRDRLQLHLDTATDRIEIGQLLTEPDKERLYSILDRWWRRSHF